MKAILEVDHMLVRPRLRSFRSSCSPFRFLACTVDHLYKLASLKGRLLVQEPSCACAPTVQAADCEKCFFSTGRMTGYNRQEM
jgi:hypothetical protein